MLTSPRIGLQNELSFQGKADIAGVVGRGRVSVIQYVLSWARLEENSLAFGRSGKGRGQWDIWMSWAPYSKKEVGTQ